MPSLTLIDAPRCPYCVRVRIALAEKGVAHTTVVIDLDDRPRWVTNLADRPSVAAEVAVVAAPAAP